MKAHNNFDYLFSSTPLYWYQLTILVYFHTLIKTYWRLCNLQKKEFVFFFFWDWVLLCREAGVQWHDLGSLQPPTPDLRWSACLGLPNCWDYRCEPPHSAKNFLNTALALEPGSRRRLEGSWESCYCKLEKVWTIYFLARPLSVERGGQKVHAVIWFSWQFKAPVGFFQSFMVSLWTYDEFAEKSITM